MADEAPSSDTPPQNGEKAPLASVEATIESSVQGGTESSINNNDADTSTITSAAVEDEKSLDFAEKLIERGSKAAKEQDYAESTDCFSRALEIRVAHYGELAPECAFAYYKYGCALLYKAQDEADPLGAVPKKEDDAKQTSSSDRSAKKAIEGESSAASASASTKGKQVANVKDREEEEEEESDDEDLAEADEDESDLDLAWKMLDVARAIVEKHSGDTMEKVDILSALAEAALEREDIETSLSDYLKALESMERLVEPDSRHLAEINFRICLCLEIGSKAEDAILYCQKAISICKSRLQRLLNEGRKSSESDQAVQPSSEGSQSSESVKTDDTEIQTLTALSAELEKKLEDLQQLVSNPKPILSDILRMVAAKAIEKNSPSSVMSSSQLGVASGSGDLDSPTVSTARTNGATGVTHLGVVGRGVKRVVMSTVTEESTPTKKLAVDPTAQNSNDNAS